MSLNRRPQIVSSALKTLTAAVASAVLLSSAATAAGLGKLTVLSALGQPLRAEIELTAVSNEEAKGLVARLASADAYRAANIEFNPALLSLRFNVEQRGGRQFVRITSTQPLNEPFVDLLLELAWDNGRLVREYTFLLDPADLRAPQPAQVAAGSAAGAAAGSATAAGRPRAATPAAEAPAQPAPAPARPQSGARADETAATGNAAPRAPAAASRYRVKSGDTLSGIATRIKPVDVSLDMMLVALYRANPDAFIGNNMNRLKSGQILSVPAGDALRDIDGGEARGTVVAHAADFNAYRAKLAGQVATSTPAREAPAGQSATGRITAKVEERPTAANESQDQLRLSKALPAPAAAGEGDKAGATTSAEDTIAKEKELADAQQRVKELEKNVNQLEELITVKSGTGAAATQRAAEGMKPIQPAESSAAGAAAGTAATEEAAKPAPKIKPKTKPAPQEKSLLDTLMDNIVYIGAGAAVLLLAALGLSQRRRKQAAPKVAAAEPSILGGAAQPASGQALFAETGGQSVDTNDSVFNSSFAPSASQLDTNGVDPLAEAELYLAYNFDTQAEDILKEALRNDPHRHPVRLKLLEIYAARKDVRAFETQATELYSLTGGKGDEWAQAASLGCALDPANPMYGAGAAAGGLAAGAGIAATAAAAAAAPEANPQTLLSQQLEQAFRNRGEHTEIVEPAATLDAVTGAPLDTTFNFDSLGLGADATALPQAGTEAKIDPKADARDDNLLDFDLGGLSFEPVPVAEPGAVASADATAVPDLQFDMEPFAPLEPAPATAASPDVPVTSLDDLAFDMEFDAPAAPQAAAATATPQDDDGFVLDLSSSGPSTDIDMAQLAKEFELPPLPDVPQTPQAAELKDPLFDLDAMDFSLADAAPVTPATPAAPGQDFDFSTDLDFATATPEAAVADAATSGQARDPLFDLDAMDFGQPAAPAAPQDDPFALPDVPAIPNPGTPVPRFDMSGFDLDLPAGDLGDLEQAVESAPQEQGIPNGLTPAQMEMETKLDLAIAYQEIGDKEGARELLDEVIKGGSGEQASRASAMRAKLA